MICSRCLLDLPEEQFSAASTSSTGKQYICKPCVSLARHEEHSDENFTGILAEKTKAEARVLSEAEISEQAITAPLAVRLAAEKSLELLPGRRWSDRSLFRMFMQRATMLGRGECMCEIYNTDFYQDELVVRGHTVTQHPIWHQPDTGCPQHPMNYEDEFWLAPPWSKRPRRWRLVGTPTYRKQVDYASRGRVLADLLSARKMIPTHTFILRVY